MPCTGLFLPGGSIPIAFKRHHILQLRQRQSLILFPALSLGLSTSKTCLHGRGREDGQNHMTAKKAWHYLSLLIEPGWYVSNIVSSFWEKTFANYLRKMHRPRPSLVNFSNNYFHEIEAGRKTHQHEITTIKGIGAWNYIGNGIVLSDLGGFHSFKLDLQMGPFFLST